MSRSLWEEFGWIINQGLWQIKKKTGVSGMAINPNKNPQLKITLFEYEVNSTCLHPMRWPWYRFCYFTEKEWVWSWEWMFDLRALWLHSTDAIFSTDWCSSTATATCLLLPFCWRPPACYIFIFMLVLFFSRSPASSHNNVLHSYYNLHSCL